MERLELVERGRLVGPFSPALGEVAVRREGEVIGTLVPARFGERATLTVGGQVLRLVGSAVRTGSEYRCEGDGRVLGIAHRSGWDHRVGWAGTTLEVVRLPEASFRPPFAVRRPDGAQLGVVHRDPASIRRSVVSLPAELPVEARLFVAWLALLRWSRWRARRQ